LESLWLPVLWLMLIVAVGGGIIMPPLLKKIDKYGNVGPLKFK